MNNINRAVVKQQAKDIIKGRFFYLFLITLIVTLLTNVTYSTDLNVKNKDFELFRDNPNSYRYENDSDYFNDFDYDNPIENFEFNSYNEKQNITELSVMDYLNGIDFNLKPNKLSALVGIIFAPLLVTMAGMYLALVRRNPNEEFNLGRELGGIFKNSFNNTYLKKLGTVLLRNVIMLALMLLLFVPGIIFYYSSYFTNEIMSDNTELSPMDAIKLSKKMIKGNRTELFLLELSFIPWYLLCCVTLGIGLIYVLPYVYTTRALYYENFRMRALQEGRITTDDFLSFNERFSRYNSDYSDRTGNVNYSSNGYSYTNPNVNANSANDTGYYYSQQNVNNQPNSEYNAQQSYNAAPESNNQNTEVNQSQQNYYNSQPEEN